MTIPFLKLEEFLRILKDPTRISNSVKLTEDSCGILIGFSMLLTILLKDSLKIERFLRIAKDPTRIIQVDEGRLRIN